MTDAELDALVQRLDDMSDISRDHAAGLLDLGHKVAVNQAKSAITTLRAQLAEAQRLMRLERTIADKNADRADRAEAALAAQIEADAAMFDNDMNLSKQICCNGQMCGCRGATAEEYVTHVIRNQPHDRTALDRYREKVLREAAAVELQYFDEDGNMSMRKLPFRTKNTILALIEKPITQGGKGE